MERTIECPRFAQRLLLPAEVHFLAQQPANFLKRVRNKMCREAVRMMAIAKILRQPLQVIHVFREVFRDVWFQNLEDTSLAPLRFRVEPGKTNHRTHAGFLENATRNLDRELPYLLSHFPLYDRANILGAHVADSVFQTGERLT